MKPMHILMASRTTPFHSIGGMQSISWDLAREFVEQGHQVTFLTTRCLTAPYQGQRQIEGVSMVFLDDTTPEVYDGRWWRASKLFVERHLIDKVDAVLSVSAAAASLLPLRPRMKPGVQFVFQAHGSSWGEAVSKWATGRPLAIAKSVKNLYWMVKDATIYPRFDAIVSVGDELGRSFLEPPLRWMTGGARCSTIVNGVDKRFFGYATDRRLQTRLKWQIPPQARVVLFAARLHPQKGCLEAVAGFKQLLLRPELQDLHMLIVGHGEEFARLKAKVADDPALHGRITLTGAVERAAMPGLMSASDAFLFPTLRREGLPMNILEALANGLPVLTSPSLKSMLSELDVQYADPRSAESLAQVLQQILTSSASNGGPSSHRDAKLPDAYTLGHCAARYVEALAPRARTQ
jgi:glycosyltransferase involved in cell wall biosynthesis